VIGIAESCSRSMRTAPANRAAHISKEEELESRRIGKGKNLEDMSGIGEADDLLFPR
jgi:hypothetical protein